MHRFSVLLGLSFLAACASRQINSPEEAPTDVLRILAYNVKHGRGMDGAIDLERIARVISEQDPDLVALQEIDEGCGRSGGVDQARRLGELCSMTPIFGPFMDYDGGRYGMALLSRLPVEASTNHVLPPGREPRTALAARVRLDDGRALVLIGIHLYATEEERLAQAETLLDVCAGEEAPVVLAGDFNSTPGSRVMERLGQAFEDPAKQGDPRTFPSPSPEREIDFFLLRPGKRFEVLEQRVVDEPLASDHRPILLVVRMK